MRRRLPALALTFFRRSGIVSSMMPLHRLCECPLRAGGAKERGDDRCITIRNEIETLSSAVHREMSSALLVDKLDMGALQVRNSCCVDAMVQREATVVPMAAVGGFCLVSEFWFAVMVGEVSRVAAEAAVTTALH